MKQIKQLILFSSLIFLVACGTDVRDDSITKRYDLWEYMTATVNYEVEYALYENNKEVDYYKEKHRMENNLYKREGSLGVTTLISHKSNIEMKEVSREIDIERYAYVGDNNIFKSSTIKNCKLEWAKSDFKKREKEFHNIIMVSCLRISGIKEKFYYGYNEGLVAFEEDNKGEKKEWLKVNEQRIE